MDTDELRAFLAVLDEGSVHGAARALGMARATLRRRVVSLEDRIGSPLFHRDRSGTQPTDAARSLEGRARVAVAAVAAVLGSPSADAPRPRVRIAGPMHSPPSVSAAAVQLLADQFPDVDVEMRYESDPAALLPNHADIALSDCPLRNDDRVRAKVLDRAPVRLVASRSTLERHGAPRSVHDLGRFRLAAYTPGRAEAPTLRMPDGSRVSVRYRAVSNSLTVIAALARQDGWVALMEVPESLGLSRDLLPVLTDIVVERQLWLLIPTVLAAAPEVRRAVEFMEATLAELTSGKDADSGP